MDLSSTSANIGRGIASLGNGIDNVGTAAIGALSGLGNSVKDIFYQASSILGETIQHLYMILVKQQIVHGIQEMVWAIVLFVACGIIYRYFNQIRASKLHLYDKTAGGLILVAAAVYLLINGINHFNVAIGYLVNPEYYAIMEAKDIIQSVRK